MGYRENREVHEGGKEVKGFIEVHGTERASLLNVNAIEYITSSISGKHTKIQTRRGELYSVMDDYETVKKMIIEATAPSFTVLKESDDDCS